VWLNTGDHDRLRRLAEALAARTWGADRSFFLVNGSSSGNHAYLLAAVGPGDEVVVGHDLHKSLLVGLILTGARPVYVAPRAHHELGLGLGVAAEDVAAALDRHPAARLVTLASSSSYYGVAADLAGVVAAAHARRVPVYVDEAWGRTWASTRRCPKGPWPPAPTARSPAPTRCCRASASPRCSTSAPAWSTRPGSPPPSA